MPPPNETDVLSALHTFEWRTMGAIRGKLFGKCGGGAQVLAAELDRLVQEGAVELMKRETGVMRNAPGGPGLPMIPVYIHLYRRR